MRTNLIKHKTAWVLVVMIVPLLAWLAVRAYENKFEALPVYSNFANWDVKNDTTQLHGYVFQTQSGSDYSIQQTGHKIIVANYFFARCPIVCPKMMKQLKKVQAAFLTDDNVQMLSFSVDPKHDSSAVLAQFANRYQIQESKWRLLTGDKPQLYRLARNGFRVTATEGDGGENDFIHSEQLILLDPQGRIRGYYTGTEEKAVEQLIHDIKKLEHEL
ncbi:protein SCO1/2 [Chitinophaga skermanii]|uniref:Protein SCO1/2 n=1 Tax=Chitinophaga skermanii TaxID=331697 RepID=A0A327R2V1_9BACT|nr:SCO family protein [Chitinophaga skermanii]RAJ10961.1 protein SCO1/2 [Chitinophaga skermanii]